MIAVVCFQWNTGFRQYLPEYVNVAARMFRRHLPLEHRFVCITDETKGFDAEIELMPLPEAAKKVSDVTTPEGTRFPSSYRRLWLLSDAARELGDLILQTDIDMVVTALIVELVEVDADFVGWRPNYNWGNGHRIGGGTWLLKPGTRTQVWERFASDPHGLIAEARAAGFRGSDQAILSYTLRGCEVWPQNAGIYQSQDLKPQGFKKLPQNARIVHFNGARKPWHMRHISWIGDHWK